MNITLFPDVPESHTFQQPPEPYGLGDSEASQIEKRLDGFVNAFKSLNLDLQRLRQELDRPMKLFWRVNDSTTSSRELVHDSRSEVRLENYYPVILCSASRRVLGAEMSEGAYIQGAGDDSEGWSRGLTPILFSFPCTASSESRVTTATAIFRRCRNASKTRLDAPSSRCRARSSYTRAAAAIASAGCAFGFGRNLRLAGPSMNR